MISVQVNRLLSTSPILILTTCLCTAILVYSLFIRLSFHFHNHAQRPRGCRRVGFSQNESNLSDEFNLPSISPSSSAESEKEEIKIKALFTYPIKSCRGIELLTATVVATGMQYDRQFCIAELVESSARAAAGKEKKWEFRTLRNKNFNKLALVSTEIWVPDENLPDYEPGLDEVRSGGVIVVRYPRVSPSSTNTLLSIGMRLGLVAREDSFRVPLNHPKDTFEDAEYPVVDVQIWKDFPLAYDYGQHLPASFLSFISGNGSKTMKKITILRTNPSSYRAIYRNAPRSDVLGYQAHTAFADAYPLHLLSISSVQDVARRCAHSLPRLSARRFRANIIVSGCAKAFDEDDWKRISISPSLSSSLYSPISSMKGREELTPIEMYTCCRTVRCKLPNVDPDTGDRHPSEPEKTLKQYRCIDKGAGDKLACLGMQCVPAVQCEWCFGNQNLSCHLKMYQSYANHDVEKKKVSRLM